MRVLFVISILFLLGGCATPPKGGYVVDDPSQLPNIQAEKSQQLSQLYIGMPLSEFKRTLPEAYVGGLSGQITAYEIIRMQKYVTPEDMRWQNCVWGFGSPPARMYKQILWFYFYNNKLVGWGQPNTWPQKPDMILEERNG